MTAFDGDPKRIKAAAEGFIKSVQKYCVEKNANPRHNFHRSAGPDRGLESGLHDRPLAVTDVDHTRKRGNTELDPPAKRQRSSVLSTMRGREDVTGGGQTIFGRFGSPLSQSTASHPPSSFSLFDRKTAPVTNDNLNEVRDEIVAAISSLQKDFTSQLDVLNTMARRLTRIETHVHYLITKDEPETEPEDKEGIVEDDFVVEDGEETKDWV